MVFKLDLITYDGTGQPDYEFYTKKFMGGNPIPITWIPGVNDSHGQTIVHTAANFGTFPYLGGLSSLEFDPSALSGHLSFWKLENRINNQEPKEDIFYQLYKTIQKRMHHTSPKQLGFKQINLLKPYYPIMKTSIQTTLAVHWDDCQVFPFIANVAWMPEISGTEFPDYNFTHGIDIEH